MKRIGDILTRNKTAVVVEDGTSYKQVTIRTNYKGVVLRGTQDGVAILTKNQFSVSAGQFILSRIDARNGAFGIIPEELEGAIVTNDFLAFDINEDEVEREFFNVFLQSPQFLEACIKASRGNTNRKRVDEGFFLNYQVNLPPLVEQRKLIKQINRARAQLALAQDAITHQQSLLAKLKQAILQEAIQGKLTANWRTAHPDVEPASQLLKRIQAEKARLIAAKKLRKEKPLSKITPAEIPFEVPKDWEWCRASDVGVVIGGLTKNTAKRGGHKTVLPYLRVANVYADRLDLTDLQEIGVSDAELDKLLLEVDDLLVVEGNGSRDQVGRIARWDGSVSPCVHQNHVIKVRLGERKVAMWAIYWFLSPAGRALIEEQARTSTGLYNLSTGKVANLPIPLPPLAEQAAIVDRVEALMTTCRALEIEIEQSRTHAAHLLQAVLKDAFSPPVKKEEKIVAFPSGFARQLMAAEILSRHNQHGMTQMKLQKLLHVVEYEAQMDEIAGDYQRQAAGPYDNRMMYGISGGLEKQKWFKTLGRGKNATYSPMEKAGQHQKYWSHWESKHPKIDGILNLLGELKPEQCEIVSTLYAAWNDLLIEDKSPTDEEIIAEASHPDRWHEAKAKIDPAKWPLAIGWMRKHQLVPTGYGRHTRKLGAS